VDLDGLTGAAFYAAIFVVVFIESGILVGFWLPGDTVLFAAGLLAADAAVGVSVWVIAAGVSVAAVAGAMVGYATGRRFGRPYLERRYGSALSRAEAFYARFGSLTLVAARFVPLARTLAPVLAGAVAMPGVRFLPAVISGAFVWGSGLVLLGYASASVPGIERAAPWVAAAIVLMSVSGGILGEALRRRFRRQAAARTTARVPLVDSDRK
jgi:membrane-associated protein